MPKLRTGLEFELVAVRDEDLSLFPQMYGIAEDMEDDGIVHEYAPYQVEVVSSPADSVADHLDEVSGRLNKLKEAMPRGTSLVPIGAYPLKFDPKVTPDERLRSLTRKTNMAYTRNDGWLSEYGTGILSHQANISTKNASDEDLVKMHGYLREVNPVGVGVTTNSAHFLGKELKNPKDFRSLFVTNGEQRILGGRRALWGFHPFYPGTSPDFKTFQEYEQFLADFSKSVSVDASGPESFLYSDVRMRTQKKNGDPLPEDERRVEFRPCDMLSTLGDNLAVATFLKTYVAARFNGLEKPWSDDKVSLDMACNLAQNYGTDFMYDSPHQGKIHMKEYVQRLIPTLRGYAQSDEQQYLDRFAGLLDRNPARQQLKDGPRGSVKRAIRDLSDEIGLK